jgi:hypothetical protein
MANRRGNPNWGKSPAFFELINQKPLETEFEKVTRELGLTPEQFDSSPALKRWVRKHKNSRYVPEQLLSHWGMTVDESVGSIKFI